MSRLDDPAFPTTDRQKYKGLTIREYIAIHTKQVISGDPDIDRMLKRVVIREVLQDVDEA